jgi:heme-degrading monooxygenase HmoA
MFAVLFEVHPKSERWDDYLALAKLLKPELEQIDGFIENIRYRSLTREGWLLSLSVWRDEKSVVRWRTQAKHHGVQEKGRFEIFSDYHLRVGQFTGDTRLPSSETLPEQRLDETEVGEGAAVTLTDASRPADWVKQTDAREVAAWLGLEHEA